MKIAVSYNNGEVFGHFGRTEQFAVYQIEEGNIISREIKGNDGLSHGELSCGASVVINARDTMYGRDVTNDKFLSSDNPASIYLLLLI